MALLSLKRNRIVDYEPSSLGLRACRFERALMSDGLTEGGVLTCRCPDGREWSLTVGMSWDALGVLRSEMTRCGVYEADETILRCVLRHWGAQEFSRRLIERVELPSEVSCYTTWAGRRAASRVGSCRRAGCSCRTPPKSVRPMSE